MMVRLGFAICISVCICCFVRTANAQDLRRRVQQEELAGSWQSLRSELRAAIAPLAEPKYEIRFLARGKLVGSPERLSISELPERIVLILGGLQGDAQACEQFAKSLERTLAYPANTRCAVFEYPNDGSIQESGRALMQLLQEFHRGSPKTKVSIVGHSMGSLVARYALESPAEPDRFAVCEMVDHLTMLCPPNHGSVLAQYADALEFADALSKIKNGSDSLISVIHALVDDGLGEACDELVPGSKFLQTLNSFDRVPGVRYSIIAGTRGPISPLLRIAGSIAISQGLSESQTRGLEKIEIGLRRVEELISSDELTLGRGDGAVSLGSARLPGVTEFMKAPIHHAEWADVEKPQVQELIRKVASLLSRT
ncbi:MAG: alpha/beta hydrolase [Planctomycetota bacterium]|nr:alpha/beta hydrolase [Planctomycetota bacterium]